MTSTTCINWNGLSEVRKRQCDEVVRKRWPGTRVSACGIQGACSYTVIVSSRRLDNEGLTNKKRLQELRNGHEKKSAYGGEREDIVSSMNERNRLGELANEGNEKDVGETQEQLKFIVQFRPEKYALDLDITEAAKETYGRLCPHVDLVKPRNPRDIPRGLQMYALEFIMGVPYSQCQPQTRTLTTEQRTKQSHLITTFAHFIGRAWPTTLQLRQQQRPARQMTGKVGASIPSKLAQLASSLPTAPLRRYSQHILSNLPIIASLPTVLNHGDVVPANIMVEPTTSSLIGLVDWAEAEYLPFGTSLYGLEYLLGCLDDSSTPTFVYYEGAEELRGLFLEELARCVGIVGIEVEPWTVRVMFARDLGVLLWFGFAWDEGKIDRVVNRKDDAEVVECLEAFLRVRGEQAML